MPDVDVGGEVEVVCDDVGTGGLVAHGGEGEFEEVNGGGVGEDDFVGVGADKVGYFLADAFGGVEPAFVPATNKALPPFLGDEGVEVFLGGVG